jgi:hypothetical protein
LTQINRHQLLGRSVMERLASEEMGMDKAGWGRAAIVIGTAGWIAELFMKSSMGMIMNIVQGKFPALLARSC